jgi:GntR family transcriptional repressor for pyruvate dehydrogenase complex
MPESLPVSALLREYQLETPLQRKKSLIALERLLGLLTDMRPGEKLPSERELAERFQMTRSPVREALVVLTIAGRIETVPGVGAFVKEQAQAGTRGAAVLILTADESPLEVTQLREALEALCVRLAIAELDPQRIEHMQTAYDKLREACVDGNVEAYLERHRSFHYSIAESTANSLVKRIEHWILYDVMTQKLWTGVLATLFADRTIKMEGLVEEHRLILEAIRLKREEKAVELVRKHVRRMIEPVLVEEQDELASQGGAM